MYTRDVTRRVRIGDRVIGGGADILVQSMTKTDTRDVTSTVRQIRELEAAGCELVRMAVLDQEAVEAVREIKKQVSIPLVADIHFDYRLALGCIDAGIDKLRINPGNIGDELKVQEVVERARDAGVPIRIGVNSGSLEKWCFENYGYTARAVFESAARHVAILEKYNFEDIVISLKCSDVIMSVEAYRMCAERFAYPMHVGMTEAGPIPTGLIKSSVGMGVLLHEGIGDTIRVSLTEDPVEEVSAGFEILKCLGLRRRGVNLVSCPTCGRCRVNLRNVVKEARTGLGQIDKCITVAIMGCEVNGPDEARHADVGLACGKGVGLIFRRGEVVARVPEADMVDALLEQVNSFDDADNRR